MASAKFLTGADRAELEKNAEELIVLLGYNGRVTPPTAPTERGNNPRRDTLDPAELAARESNLDAIGARMYRR